MKGPFLLILIFLIAVVIVAMGKESQALQSNTGENLLWPLSHQLGDRVFVQMQVDNNRSDGSRIDYECREQYTYDGHRGTDFTLYNFRHMDEGVAIYAAAEGQVAFSRFDEFDREYWPPVRSEPNGLSIRGPGFDHQYWHMRTNSITVNVGEHVERGQLLGYIGSSGQTAVPHLHFEVWDGYGGTWAYRDPFTGSCSDSPSMWADGGYEYPGAKEFRLFDADIFTKFNLQGNERNNFFGERALKDRPFRPVVFGADEALLVLWTEFQGDPDVSYRVRVLKPDGTEHGIQTKVSPQTNQGYQWHVFFFPWQGQVTEVDFGTWTARVEFNGEIQKEFEFDVGERSIYAPRFYPLAGLSFRLNGQEIRDELSLSGLEEGDVVFAIRNAPDFVRIEGDELVIAADASPQFRNTFFEVSATDSEARFDLKRYHLVDLSKPVE